VPAEQVDRVAARLCPPTAHQALIKQFIILNNQRGRIHFGSPLQGFGFLWAIYPATVLADSLCPLAIIFCPCRANEEIRLTPDYKQRPIL
jgi:hypothetical protein